MPLHSVADLLQPARHIPMLLALIAVVVVAPFERALFVVSGLTMTSVEVVALVALASYANALRRDGRDAWPLIPMPVLLGAAAFLVAIAVAALTAPVEPANARRFVARMAVALALAAMSAHVINTPARARLIAGVIVGTATVVASIAVLEWLQIPAVMAGLVTFRPGFHFAAGQLRATSTLPYPTIASMYLEVAFVAGLWLLITASQRRIVMFLAVSLIGVGIIATFTRAGLLAMATAILGIATLRVCRLALGSTAQDAGTGVRGLARRWGAREPATLVALTAVLASCFFVAHTPELLAARLTTEGARWYGARYEVPSALQMSTAEHHRVRVSVVNTGRLTWNPHGNPPFALSYHWLRPGGASGDVVIEFEGQRTPFPGAVTPGQRIELLADVIAPGAPGTYTLVWDVVHERRAWLSTEGVAPARSAVTVSGESRTVTTTPRRQLPAAIVRPTRPALWSAALDMARDHPWLGVGPDNYRLASERYLGTAFFDSRVHANNMYLEVLAGAGVPGLLALLWLTAATGLALARRVRDAARDTHTAAVAAFALWMVIVGHGLVDSFLAFTPTYVSFAVAGGWSLSPGLAGGEPHAHRV